MVKNYVPDRGDLVWLNFDPTKGHEQTGVRPAIVLTPTSFNDLNGLMLACPVTSKIKGYPFEVRVEGIKIDGVVLADQLRCIDWKARGVKFIEKTPMHSLSQVQEIIKLLIAG
jgi:mRNA interferase MazF